MKKLVDEYKMKASNFDNKARWNESQIAELRIEHEVALKRAAVAENQLTALRHQLHNSTDISRARATEAERRELLIKRKFEILQAAFIGGISGSGPAKTPQAPATTGYQL